MKFLILFTYISNVIPFPCIPSTTPLSSISPYPSSMRVLTYHGPTPTSQPEHSCTLGHLALTGPRASPPIDARLDPFSPSPNFSIGVLVLRLMVGCEHLYLYLSESGRASQETAVSGSVSKHFLALARVSGFGVCVCNNPVATENRGIPGRRAG